MKTLLISVNDALALTSGQPPRTDVEAFTNALLWSQSVARTRDPNIASDGYFTAMTRELSRVAWNVLEASSVNLKIAGERVAAADIIKSALAGRVPTDFATQLEALFRLARSGSAAGNDAADLLSTWWAAASVSAEQTSMFVGPLAHGLTTTTTLLRFSFGFRADHWRSLFVQRSTESLALRIESVRMSFVPDIWSVIGSAVVDKLGTRARAFIRQLSLDL